MQIVFCLLYSFFKVYLFEYGMLVICCDFFVYYNYW